MKTNIIFQPEIGKFFAFDHLKFYVGNAKQAASFYTSRFGFEYVAYQVNKMSEVDERNVGT